MFCFMLLFYPGSTCSTSLSQVSEGVSALKSVRCRPQWQSMPCLSIATRTSRSPPSGYEVTVLPPLRSNCAAIWRSDAMRSNGGVHNSTIYIIVMDRQFYLFIMNIYPQFFCIRVSTPSMDGQGRFDFAYAEGDSCNLSFPQCCNRAVLGLTFKTLPSGPRSSTEFVVREADSLMRQLSPCHTHFLAIRQW